MFVDNFIEHVVFIEADANGELSTLMAVRDADGARTYEELTEEEKKIVDVLYTDE